MTRLSSTRAKTVAAPKKPAPRAKAKEKAKAKTEPKATGWTAKATTTRRTTAGGRGSDAARSVGGRGSNARSVGGKGSTATRRTAEPAPRRTTGGRGSDVSTPASRREVADVYAGGRSSGRSYSNSYSGGGGS